MAFYQRIRDLREDADKTQSELAASVSYTHLTLPTIA